ncbi:AI-2E family transporter [Nakamurella silvestris]|nr:AI-2E family transporter [Nakamurella silvestris]
MGTPETPHTSRIPVTDGGAAPVLYGPDGGAIAAGGPVPGGGSIDEAEVIATEIAEDATPLGRLGPRFNWRSPFFVGMAATAGVAVTIGVIELLRASTGVLILIGLALFLAVGMEPAVAWLVAHRFPRWLGVLVVIGVVVGVIAAFFAAAIPALVTQGEQLAAAAPGYLKQANDHSSFIGRLNDQFHLEDKLQKLLDNSAPGLTTGLIGAGVAVFSALADSLIVFVLTVYFLADMPRLRRFAYRLVPHTRRPRAILIGDEILSKVGSYVLGNLIVSAVAGGLTYVWLIVFDVPYAFLLAIMVALLDLVPVVGSTIAGIIVALVTLTISLPLTLATVAFFVVYRLGEDYLLVPRIIGRRVQIPALVTVVSVLIGGALLGILGALVAIPVAAALLLLAREVLFPRLDRG